MKRLLRIGFPDMLLPIAFSLIAGTASAQHLVFIYGHALYASPLDQHLKDGYHSGLGVEGGAGVGWKKTFLVGTVGFTDFFHTSASEAGDLHYVPVKAGIRQYILLKNLYVHGDVGVGNIKDKFASDARFSGDVGVGVKLLGFEAQLDYDGFSEKDPSGYASWIGIKAGFALGL